jgi:hypothetical protein
MRTLLIMVFLADACWCAAGKLTWTVLSQQMNFIFRLFLSVMAAFVIAAVAVALMFCVYGAIVNWFGDDR